jgi:hypothetical protein
VSWTRRSPLIAALVAVAACQSGPPFLAIPTPADGEPHEQMPAFASVRVDGRPLAASRPVVIRIQQPGFADEVWIGVGQQIHASFGVSSGDYQLTADQERCILPVTLRPETETDVALELRDDGTCRLVPIRQHAVDAVDHDSAMGDVSAQVPVALGREVSMDIRSLDDPPDAVPAPDMVDESGLLIISPVPTGRYEVRLIVDGEVVDTQTVEVDEVGRSDPVRFEVPSG